MQDKETVLSNKLEGFMQGKEDTAWMKDVLSKAVMASVVEQRRKRRWGIFFKIVYLLVFIFFLLFALAGPEYKANMQKGLPGYSSKPHLAVVDVKGVIAAGEQAGAENINKGLKTAFSAANSRAVVLDVNSPGGSPVQSGMVYRMIRELRDEYPDKKVYAVISDLGASGAYYIASAADEIYADPASVVGSIGVISKVLGYEDLLQKWGLELRTFTAGKNKNFLDGSMAEKPEQRAHMQTLLDTMHKQFIHAVKEGRGERLQAEDDSDIFSGLFWTGEQAKPLGLVDELGSIEDVADLLGVDEKVNYSPQLNFYDALLGRVQVGISHGLSALLNMREQTDTLLLK